MGASITGRSPFEHTAEQLQFQETLRSFFSEQVTSEYLRARIQRPAETDAALWSKLRELGIFEWFSGSDAGAGGLADLCILAEESCRALVPEPLIEAVFSGPYLLCRELSAQQRADFEAILGSELCAKVVKGEARGTCGRIAAKESGQSPNARGSVRLEFVGGAENASFVLGFERKRRAAGTVKLFSLASQESKTIQELKTLDLTQSYSSLKFGSALTTEIDPAASQRISLVYALLKCFEALGACERVLEMTVEYVKVRKQFDVPVGGFQSVQRLIVDAALIVESCKALARFAAWAAEYDQQQFQFAACAAVSKTASESAQCIEKLLQAHGGIGFTWEYDLHLYLRRVKVIEALFGFGEDDYLDFLELAYGPA